MMISFSNILEKREKEIVRLMSVLKMTPYY